MGKLLWQPSVQRVRQTHLYRFMDTVNQTYDRQFENYSQLFEWSVAHIDQFWQTMWEFAPIIASQPYNAVIQDPQKMPGARWFPGARLNFAENLLRYRDDHTAIIFKGETQPPQRISYRKLYDEVARVADSLKAMGVGPQDRVVGFMPNMPETIVAMLAAASLGATWSSCSPDFGPKGVLDRFGQIEPKVLFCANGYSFKGRHIDCLPRVADIVQQIPSIERVVVVPYTELYADIDRIPKAVHYRDFRSTQTNLSIDFAQLPFSHPLYIMYSSGTTGLPKCMVQGAGGVLINQIKEHMLHTDVGREDTVFYFTTCGWMMWNWLTCALSLGATLVLFDGNPFHPHPGALWQMAQDEKITVFGTSAGYLAALQQTGVVPKDDYDLSPLRALLSTGSPLSEEGFAFVYEQIKSDLQLASISGGTDLNGCFALGNPMGPVYSGELQCRGLAMDVDAFDETGQSVRAIQGELVCKQPFPSMPLYFWNDPDNRKYHNAYFDVFPNTWCHGDFIEVNERGGVKIYGRSDATLNPGGVRIGTADIYRQIEQLPEVDDSVVIGQNWKNDVRIILFVKLAPGQTLDAELEHKIINQIRENTSPRHVPAKIVAVADIPYTLNMKKVELAVKKIVHGQPVTNQDALGNPECLKYYADIPELQVD